MAHIVQTPGTLSGKPRIEGTRIGVQHIVGKVETGASVEDVAEEVYPCLSEEQVRAAVEWASDNPIKMTRQRLEDDLAHHQHTVEKLETELDWLGEPCPECGEHDLDKSGDIPDGVGLLTCPDCGTIVLDE